MWLYDIIEVQKGLDWVNWPLENQYQTSTICKTYGLAVSYKISSQTSREKHLPKVHGNYYNRIKIYIETEIYYQILADNMFRNYFLISYQRHMCFCSISIYIYQTVMGVFFEETISVYSLTRQKESSPSCQKWHKYSPYPLSKQKLLKTPRIKTNLFAFCLVYTAIYL